VRQGEGVERAMSPICRSRWADVPESGRAASRGALAAAAGVGRSESELARERERASEREREREECGPEGG